MVVRGLAVHSVAVYLRGAGASAVVDVGVALWAVAVFTGTFLFFVISDAINVGIALLLT